MDCKVIKINTFTDTVTLKLFILQKLKLVDYKKNYVSEFNERLKSYLDRNKNLKITFEFDTTKIERDIAFQTSLTNRKAEPYPDNFEMGNPHNRWFSEGRVITEEERLKEKVILERNISKKITEFKVFCSTLEQIGCGQIIVINNN